MIPRPADKLFTEIKALAPRERLRLVERVIHDLTDGGEVEAAPGNPGAILGLFVVRGRSRHAAPRTACHRAPLPCAGGLT